MAGYDDGYGQQPQMQFAMPPLTFWVKRLMIANAAVFLAIVMVGFAGAGTQGEVIRFLGVDPTMWRGFVPAVWEFVTYGFVHDPRGLGHLLYNMLGLYFFGTMIESSVGPRRFLVLYGMAALSGAVLHLTAMLISGGDGFAVGASGAVLGVIVAAATMTPHRTIIFLIFPMKLWVLAAIIVAGDLFAVVLSLQPGSASDGVAHWVHLGGIAYGFFAVRRRWIYRDPLAALERKRAVAQEEQRLSDDARMDQLLAKIQREGMGKLSRSERAFLTKASQRGGKR